MKRQANLWIRQQLIQKRKKERKMNKNETILSAFYESEKMERESSSLSANEKPPQFKVP
jgi:hypothetical protein